MSVTALHCPGCANELRPGERRCTHCGLPLSGPAATELWQVDRALEANDQRRQALLSRRDTLLAFLRSQAGQHTKSPAPSGAQRSVGPRQYASPSPAPARAPAAQRSPAPVVRPETSRQSVQNVLLALGGLLLAVAAVVFTVVAWGRFGITGRAAILLTFTAIALTTPVVLIRRKLNATAETIALIGLVLMALDGYAAYRVGAFGLDGTNEYGYSAAVLAVMVATAIGYSRLVPLRLLTPVAVVLAQPVVPLVTAAFQTTITGSALAFTIVAGLNVALIAATRHRQALAPERVIAAIFAVIAASGAVPVALVQTFIEDSPWRPAGVLALSGAVVIGAALVARAVAPRVLLAGSGILLVATAAIGAVLPELGTAGAVAPALAALLVTLGAFRAPKTWRLGGLGAGSVLLVAGGLAVIRPVGHALLGPFSWLLDPWSGAGDSARIAIDSVSGQNAAWSGHPVVLPAVMLLAAGAALVAHSVAGRRGAAAAVAAGVVAATGVAPVALDLTRPGGLIVQGTVAAVLCLVAGALKRPLLCWPAGAAGLSLGALALAGCLAEQGSTVVGLTAAIAVFAAAAFAARLPEVGAAAAGLVVLAATGQAAAVTLAAGYDGAAASWAMLGVAAIAAAGVHLAEGRLPHHARAGAIAASTASALAAISALFAADRPELLLAVAGGVVVAVALRRPRDGEREVFLGFGAIPLAGALLTIAEPMFEAYATPYTWLGHGWGPAPHLAREAVGPAVAWSGTALAPAVLAVVAIAIAAGAASLWGRAVAVRVAVPLAAATGGVLPLAFDLPWVVALITLGAIACTLLAAAALSREHSLLPASVSGPTAAVLTGTMTAWSLAAAPATVLALTTLSVATLLAAVAARTRPVVLTSTVVSAASAALAAVAATMAAGQPARIAAFAALAIAAGLAGLAAVLRRERPQESLCCEAVAVGGGLLGIAMSATNPLTLSIALGVAGLVVGATALRPDRRAASYVGTGLVILGSWVRLADLGVTAPEAYSVPVGVTGLVIGWLRWRQRRHLSSWLVFAPGLASGLLPSLVALLVGSQNTVRPFALGAMALVVVLVGGWQRLQAPLVLGGGVLAAVTLHELAPWVSEVVAALPRWVPLAAAGLLLLLIGATYEQRRRDLRRVRDAVVRMS